MGYYVGIRIGETIQITAKWIEREVIIQANWHKSEEENQISDDLTHLWYTETEKGTNAWSWITKLRLSKSEVNSGRAKSESVMTYNSGRVSWVFGCGGSGLVIQ